METRVRVIAALTEGNSIRGTARLMKVDKNAVMDFGIRVGEGCAHLHNRLVRGLAAHFIQCDETWSFIAKKSARCNPDIDPPEWGDAYTFLGFDLNSKLILSYHVGHRDTQHTDTFIADLRSRITVIPHVSTDGFSPYIAAILSYFMGQADFGQVVKNYRSGGRRDDHRYEPPRDPFITKKKIAGAPSDDDLCTSGVERVNLTLRHVIGRTRRLVLAFSKDPDHHKAAVALAYAWYNLGLVVRTTRLTPAMAVGVSKHIWEVEEFLEAILAEPEIGSPMAKPLAHRTPAGTSRALPGGRGFLRVVGGASSPTGPTPAAAPPPPVAPVQVAAAGSLEVAAKPLEPTGQLDLFGWKPRAAPPARPLPPKGTQLGLFGADLGALFGIDLEP